MSKSIHSLLLLVVLTFFTGCQTIHGAATGFGQDVHNVCDSGHNGWKSLVDMDAWMKANLW